MMARPAIRLKLSPLVGYLVAGFDVSYHTNDAAKARTVFDALSEGGKVGMAFAETFWSPGFGSFTDRFGIPWMVNTSPAADWKPGG